MNNSKPVLSNQIDIHENLKEYILRNNNDNYQRPIADFSKKTFGEIINWIDRHSNKNIILDMGCGIGESTYHLAQKYPNELVIGIDKSDSRINKKNDFKNHLPENLYLVRGELLDLWYLFYLNKESLNIHKQYILYPNPWPKKHHIKRRWYANPIFPYIVKLSQNIELRTNWELYAKEFSYSCELLGLKNLELKKYAPEKMITPFELKYLNSGHDLYQLLSKAL